MNSPSCNLVICESMMDIPVIPPSMTLFGTKKSSNATAIMTAPSVMKKNLASIFNIDAFLCVFGKTVPSFFKYISIIWIGNQQIFEVWNLTPSVHVHPVKLHIFLKFRGSSLLPAEELETHLR